MSPPTLSRAALQAADELAGSPRCAGCGCTNHVACDPPCYWVSGQRLQVAREQLGLAIDVETRPIPLRELVPLCSACADSVVEAWPEPRGCVAPTWPAWACDEDGEVAWIRADLIGRAAALLADVTGEDFRLDPDGPVVCIWDRRPQREWEWMLSEAHPDDAGDDAAMYVRFTISGGY